MNSQERLDLKKMVDASECEDNTETIRKICHSPLILEDIRKIEQLKRAKPELRESAPEEFAELCRTECQFLFNRYTDIFNKLLKDELHLGIMMRLIQVLRMIENGEVDQHEGSVHVGKYLKELYVDSALRRAENLDREHAAETPEKVEARAISWKQYKHISGKQD